MQWWIVGLVANAIVTIGIWCWARNRYARASARDLLVTDGRERQQQALAIHDSVVQSIAAAKLSLELGERERGMAALEQSLVAARRIITDLLGEPGSLIDLGPGDLRRVPRQAAPGGASEGGTAAEAPAA